MVTNMIYTGIGSRSTPTTILATMTKIATYMTDRKHTLRSGKAGGADSAFQQGVQIANCNNASAEIYIPWPGFTSPDMLATWDYVGGSNPDAAIIAESIHPAWNRCSQGARKLHTRNVMQILGADLNTPSDFVLFYAPVRNRIVQGGTGTAVKLAQKHNIPCINMLYPTWRDELLNLIR